MNLKTLLIVSHDAGGANLLAYWCINWSNKVNFVFMVAGPAVKIFNDLGLANAIVDHYPNHETIDMVVTSTGWQSDLEYDAINWARNCRIPVASYLDHWVNYKSRFIRNHVEILPDEIWAGDRDSFNLAMAIFSPKDVAVRYMRNRYFLELKNKVIKAKLKKQSLTENNLLICLEPIRNAIAFEDVYSNLAAYLSQSRFKDLSIIIRDHPSATDTGLYLLRHKLEPHFAIRMSEGELWQDLTLAVAVVGYQSSVLAYASYLNITAISYFPIKKLEPILPHKVIEYI